MEIKEVKIEASHLITRAIEYKEKVLMFRKLKDYSTADFCLGQLSEVKGILREFFDLEISIRIKEDENGKAVITVIDEDSDKVLYHFTRP